MSATTIGHHVCVVIFAIYSCFNDYEEENVCRLLVVYAIFSTFAYLVNLLLATRFFKTSVGVQVLLSAFALLIYVTCCGINWTWQVYYIHRLIFEKDMMYNVPLWVYMFLILFVVWDDIVLMKWLLTTVIRLLKNGKVKSP